MRIRFAFTIDITRDHPTEPEDHISAAFSRDDIAETQPIGFVGNPTSADV